MYSQNNHLNNQLKVWLLALIVLIILIILVGGLTRLTDSGLSITTWELFVGFIPPLTNDQWVDYFELYKTIPEFNEQNYNMTLKEFKKEIVDQKRINFILNKIKGKSKKLKIDPKITNRIWKNMIWSYIDYERRNFKKK